MNHALCIGGCLAVEAENHEKGALPSKRARQAGAFSVELKKTEVQRQGEED